MHKKKEIIQDVTLHDLDVANARPQVPAPRVMLGSRPLALRARAGAFHVGWGLLDELSVLPLLRADSPFLSVMFSN